MYLICEKQVFYNLMKSSFVLGKYSVHSGSTLNSKTFVIGKILKYGATLLQELEKCQRYHTFNNCISIL